MKYEARVNGRILVIDLDRPGEVAVDGVVHAVDLRLVDGESLYSLILDNVSHEVIAERRDGRTEVLIAGHLYEAEVEDAHLAQLRAMGGQEHAEHGSATVNAPMPGLVVKVMVSGGDVVERDQGLFVLEAMKMENVIRSPRPGIVRSVAVAPGETVNLGDVLAVVDEGD